MLIFTIIFAFSRMAIMTISFIIIIVNFLLFACSITRREELHNDFANISFGQLLVYAQSQFPVQILLFTDRSP